MAWLPAGIVLWIGIYWGLVPNSPTLKDISPPPIADTVMSPVEPSADKLGCCGFIINLDPGNTLTFTPGAIVILWLSWTPIYSATLGVVDVPILIDWLITPGWEIIASSITTLPSVNETPPSDLNSILSLDPEYLNPTSFSNSTPFPATPKSSGFPLNWYLPKNSWGSVWLGLTFNEPVNSNGTVSFGPIDVLVVLKDAASKVFATFMSILSPADDAEASKSIKVEAEVKPLTF